MSKKIRPYFIVLLLITTVSCSKFSKILKDPDPELRYTAAMAYYNDGDCMRAQILLEDLLPLYRGTEKSEEIFYHYAKSHFCEKDYLLAGFYLKQFVKTFPQSKYSEECSYLAALCSYKESPRSNLDQSETTTALADLQVFLDRYPQTEKKDTINTLIYKLNNKLEIKDYDNARLYHQTLRYKSAVLTYNNFLKDYPATELREQVMYYIIQANYSLAVNSIAQKKEERLKETIKSYDTFATIFPESEFLPDANRLKDMASKELERTKDKQQ